MTMEERGSFLSGCFITSILVSYEQYIQERSIAISICQPEQLESHILSHGQGEIMLFV
jgi:hypothetical protein